MISNLYYFIFADTDYQSLLMKLILAVAIFIGFRLFAIFFSKNAGDIVNKLFKIKDPEFSKAFIVSVQKPFNIILTVIGLFLALLAIPFAPTIKLWLTPLLIKLLRCCLILAASVSLQNFVNNITVFVKKFDESKNKTIINFFVKVSKAAIIVLTAIIVLKEFGYDMNGIIAGLGLGGLTFALAAQDTASNFFSGVIILFDKPFAIGDWIAVAGNEGVVEEMSFRSCRIRTFDNALISIPNSKLSGDSVTNWTKMNLRKTKITIGLTYSTTNVTVNLVCQQIKEKLISFQEIKTDTINVWLDSFNPSSLGVVVQFHSFPIPLAEHTQLRQKVHFMIMDIIHANETAFAFETRTIIQE